MVAETLHRIEQHIQAATTLPAAQQAELLRLMGLLRAELTTLEASHTEQAVSLVGFAERSAHEATRTQKNPHLLALAMQGLETSVDELAVSHPHLVQVVNALSTLLANSGV